MLRIPHCLDSRLTNRGKVVSPMHQLLSAPQKHIFSASGTHFLNILPEPLCILKQTTLGGKSL
jgi:hypothetical protein